MLQRVVQREIDIEICWSSKYSCGLWPFDQSDAYGPTGVMAVLTSVKVSRVVTPRA